MALRILIASNCEPVASFGAGQLAARFGESLGESGAEITHWYPQLDAGLKWWQHLPWSKKNLNEFVEKNGPFDVIDCPAEFITSFKNHRGLVVARSIQPVLHYIVAQLCGSWQEVVEDFGKLRRLAVSCAYSAQVGSSYLEGIHRADRILCLGTIEYDWMHRNFKHLRSKLFKHCLGPSASEQSQLAALRYLPRDTTKRVLWIGRWCPQKGTRLLEHILASLFRADAKATATIAGFVSMEYLELNDELRKNERIKFVPTFTRAELMELLAAHNIGLLTSRAEGWGLVLNEMLEAGLTVYSTEAGGFIDLKPFFPNQLKKLTAASIPFVREEPEDNLQEYYGQFSWASVGRAYMDMLGTGFPAKRSNDKTVGE